MKKDPAARFFLAAALSLLVATVAGAWAVQIVAWPEGDISVFTKLRPLHVTFALAWIFLAAMGGVYAWLPELAGRGLVRPGLARLQFWLLAVAGVVATSAYAQGIFTGREYLNFPLPVSLLIGAAWVCYLVNVIGTARAGKDPWPVWVWMWITGAVAFAYTYTEAHLWRIPFFGDTPVRDLSVQWKSYGALTGSWNMFVYGLAIALGDRLAGGGTGRSKKAFFFYWLGLTNLMFGWAHHTYHLPQAEWIRWMAFVISMTEWVIFVSLMMDLAQPFERGVWQEAPERKIPRAFLSASTFWVIVNLILALLISIPTLNWFTHGTHITVAHAMGTTIGINSTILLGIGFCWLLEKCRAGSGTRRAIWAGFWLMHFSLLAFFLNLVVAGGIRGLGTTRSGWSFAEVQERLAPWLAGLPWTSAGLVAGLALLGCSWLGLLPGARRATRSA